VFSGTYAPCVHEDDGQLSSPQAKKQVLSAFVALESASRDVFARADGPRPCTDPCVWCDAGPAKPVVKLVAWAQHTMA
jgi:hypothetical protein